MNDADITSTDTLHPLAQTILHTAFTLLAVTALAVLALIVYIAAERRGYGARTWFTTITPARRANEHRAAQLRFRWPEVAANTGLSKRRLRPTMLERIGPSRPAYLRAQMPRIRATRTDDHGLTLTLDLRTARGAVDKSKLAKALPALAAAWGVRMVTLDDTRTPSLVELRLHTHLWPLPPLPATPPEPTNLPIGYTLHNHNPVTLDLSRTPALGLHGPIINTTGLVQNLLVQLTAHPAIEFFIADGKAPEPTTGDYEALKSRAVIFSDDPWDARTALTKLVDIRRHRAERMLPDHGVHNFWEAGPVADLPLIVLVVDGYGTYLARKPGRGKAVLEHNQVIDENNAALLDLLRYGGSAGIVVLVTTTERLPARLAEYLPHPIALRATDKLATSVIDGIRKDPRNPAVFHAHTDISAMPNPDDHSRIVYFRTARPAVPR